MMAVTTAFHHKSISTTRAHPHEQIDHTSMPTTRAETNKRMAVTTALHVVLVMAVTTALHIMLVVAVTTALHNRM